MTKTLFFIRISIINKNCINPIGAIQSEEYYPFGPSFNSYSGGNHLRRSYQECAPFSLWHAEGCLGQGGLCGRRGAGGIVTCSLLYEVGFS
jgi:hypothetical protein